jgi:hypothetical protein
MQDYLYVNADELDITLEVSDVKWPSATEIPEFWNQNLPALLKYMSLLSYSGVRAKVIDAGTGKPVQNCAITVGPSGGGVIGKPIRCSGDGQVFRLLKPVDSQVPAYRISISADGYVPFLMENVVVSALSSSSLGGTGLVNLGTVSLQALTSNDPDDSNSTALFLAFVIIISFVVVLGIAGCTWRAWRLRRKRAQDALFARSFLQDEFTVSGANTPAVRSRSGSRMVQVVHDDGQSLLAHQHSHSDDV